MEIDYSKLAFISTLRYMRIFNDYPLGAGGGSITHGLGYIPYFFVFALDSVADTLVSLQSGDMEFPSGGSATYIINVTSSVVTVTEVSPPPNPTTYFIRVYEDPLP